MALTAEEFIGGWLLGGCLASVMFGLLLFQSAYYFLHYRSDYLPYKILVSLLTLICSVSWSVIIALMWHYLVASRDSPISELKHNPGIQFVVFCAPWPAGLLSQLFFAMRCYWVSDRNKTYLAVFTFLIFASAAAGLAAIIVDGLATASFTGGGRTPAIVKSVGSLIQAWLWINAATDLVISTCLALQLNKGRKYRGQTTEQVLTRVLKLSLTTAALSFAWATVDAIVVQLTAGHSNYQLVLFLPLPFIYSLCAIATLNFRDTLRTIAFSADSPADPTNGGGGHTSHDGGTRTGTSGGGGQSRSMISMRTGTGREGMKSRDEEEMVEESEVHVELKITKEASAEQIVLDQLSGKSFNSKRG